MYKRLQEICKSKGTNVTVLCKAITGSSGNLSTWKKGYMRSDYLAKAADILECSTDYILDRKQNNSNISITSPEQKVLDEYRSLNAEGQEYIDHQLYIANKVYKQEETAEPEIISIKYAYMPVSAGTGIDLSEENYKTINIKSNEITRTADFAVKVSGDSMQPTYKDGDILLIESMPCINKGDIGVFVLDGEGFVKEFGGDRLISHNEQYDDIMLSAHDVVMCSGKVIGTLSKKDIV